MSYYPNVVQFELVQGCNRNCFFCATNGFERKFDFVSFEILRKQCELIKNSKLNPRIALVGHGEPTLHPKFFECVKLMRDILPTHYFQIMTNGFLIKKDLNNICKFFDSGINDIILDQYSDSKFDENCIQKLLNEYCLNTGKKVKFGKVGEKCSLYGEKNSKKYRLVLTPAIDEKEISLSRKLTNQCGGGLPKDTSCKKK